MTATLRTGPGSEPANDDLGRKFSEWLGHSGPAGLFRTCGSCRHMVRAPEPARCRRYGMTPPVEVVLAGCDGYSDECEAPLDGDAPY